MVHGVKESVRRKRLVLGVTGSISAYKSPNLARYFIKRGYDVRVVMTESATKFITPLTFQSLTKNPVTTSLWSEGEPGAIGHIELADWADVVVIAPATADCIAKLAYGMAESSILAIALATKAPLVVAPAMNVNMFEHPQTQENIASLRGRGIEIVEPESGELACGWKGQGRLASAYEIYSQTERVLGPGDLIGQRVLVSAGPTREAIDPVRFLSNRSSGKMGIAIAREAYRRGAHVTFVHGPLPQAASMPSGVQRIAITSAEDMYNAVVERTFGLSGSAVMDVVVMTAAVADFRASSEASEKIKKSTSPRSLDLTPTKDVLAALGSKRGESMSPVLVGFAVETCSVESLLEEARRKLEVKNLDLVVGNLAADSFDKDTNRVWIVPRGGAGTHLETASKKRIARGVWDAVVTHLQK